MIVRNTVAVATFILMAASFAFSEPISANPSTPSLKPLGAAPVDFASPRLPGRPAPELAKRPGAQQLVPTLQNGILPSCFGAGTPAPQMALGPANLPLPATPLPESPIMPERPQLNPITIQEPAGIVLPIGTPPMKS
jgi:hypothetical protein